MFVFCQELFEFIGESDENVQGMLIVCNQHRKETSVMTNSHKGSLYTPLPEDLIADQRKTKQISESVIGYLEEVESR